MTTTMQLIAKQTVGAGGASSVTFSNIPQTYTDLKIVISARTTNTLYGETIRIKPNGSTANGSARILRGYGNGTSSYTYSNVLATNNSLGNGATANTFASIEVYCPNYTSSNYKSFSADSVSENNDTNGRDEMTASLWSNTAAITSLVFDNDAGSPFSFTEGSTFYLYGISNSTTTQATTVPYASGGDVITTDGSYWYHAFKTSGSFTPLKNLTADVLVVAGGGGGGYYWGAGGGGGGAGGLLAFTAESLTSGTNYTCTIGSGGAVQIGSPNINGYNGGDSQFGSLTLVKGGGGGATPNSGSGSVGGSGGGGGSSSGVLPGGAGTSGQGNAGGSGTGVSNAGAGGGGGKGAVGGDGGGFGGGAGGAGVNTYSSWASATSTGASGYYAGGGGGGIYQGSGSSSGAGGAGGGGAAGAAGTANTGGGGGGAYYTSTTVNPGTGGSGIIIVRYSV